MSVFDTNILIDYLQGRSEAKAAIKADLKPSVSVITYMELLAGSPGEEEKAAALAVLSYFNVIFIDKNIADVAVNIRKSSGMKLPDAIILATARCHGTNVITRDKVFGVEVPY